MSLFSWCNWAQSDSIQNKSSNRQMRCQQFIYATCIRPEAKLHGQIDDTC
jgi:hypothetical protein